MQEGRFFYIQNKWLCHVKDFAKKIKIVFRLCVPHAYFEIMHIVRIKAQPLFHRAGCAFFYHA